MVVTSQTSYYRCLVLICPLNHPHTIRITVDFIITRIRPLFAFYLFSERQYSLRLAASASIVSTYFTVDAYAVIVVSPLIGFEVDCHLKTQPGDKTAPLQEKVGKK